MPNPLPQGFAPRSLLDSQTIVAPGRLVMEKQFTKLVRGLRRRRRPAAGLAAADPRPGPPAPAPGPRDPQARPVGPGRAAGQHHRHAQRVGPGQHLRAHLARRGVPARAAGGDGRRRPLRQLRLRVRVRARSSGTRSTGCSSRPSRSPACPRRCSGSAPTTTSGTGSGPARSDSAAEWDADLIAGRWVAIFEAAIARRAGRPRYAALSRRHPRRSRPRRRRTTRPASRPRRPGTPRSRWRSRPPGPRRTSGWWCRRTRPRTPVVVLPMAARHRFLQELAAAEVPSYLSLRDPAANGWHERRAPVPVLASDLLRGRTSVVAIEPWPVSAGDGPATRRSSARAARSRSSSGRRASTGSSSRRRRNRYAQRLPRGRRPSPPRSTASTSRRCH